MIAFNPYESAYRNAEHQWKKVVVAMMKKMNITQIDLRDVELFLADELTLISNPEGFLRIKCKFQIEENK